MHIITWKRCKEFAEKYPDSLEHLRAWRSVLEKSTFETPAALKEVFGHASFPGGNHVIFNIAGNKYRLVTVIRYNRSKVYIRAILTHEEYDKLDVTNL